MKWDVIPEYRVPRSLDVPDKIGIPFFSTAEFFIFLLGVVIGAFVWFGTGWEVNLRAWLLIWVPMAFLFGPRRFGPSGWTAFQLARHRVGRCLRPKRTVWKP